MGHSQDRNSASALRPDEAHARTSSHTDGGVRLSVQTDRLPGTRRHCAPSPLSISVPPGMLVSNGKDSTACRNVNPKNTTKTILEESWPDFRTTGGLKSTAI